MPESALSTTTMPRFDAVPETGLLLSHTPASAVVVAYPDSLDMRTVDDFRCAYRGALHELTASGIEAGDLIVLDLSHTDFVSVDATAALVEAKDLTESHGIDFALVTATRGVYRALDATGTRRQLTCRPTVEAALVYERTEGAFHTADG
ncbi:STAS domain-containing protein [Prescottella subtropica]|uniref:STAS domain-containing protein n=1 Tax=Prescottella subtropica TaxID=2545757 RepID=UPI0010F7317E|nr:STAS domain-containing protein [Prescottella subtropica]